MYPELKGRVALVTGGASGLGAAVVGHLLREGVRVVVADLHASDASGGVAGVLAPIKAAMRSTIRRQKLRGGGSSGAEMVAVSDMPGMLASFRTVR